MGAFWKGFSAALAVALVAVSAAFALSLRGGGGASRHFAEIDVERINVVEADGTVKLVIANRERAPDQVFDGQVRPRQEDNKSPGITFFDDAGDEVGGLKIRGDRRVGPSANRHLTFDQHRGDQVLALTSDEDESGRLVGMTIWDRPDTPLAQLIERAETIQAMPPGPERAALEQSFGVTRLFLGKRRNGEAALSMADAEGRERIRLSVSAAGEAQLTFLDERGGTVLAIPD